MDYSAFPVHKKQLLLLPQYSTTTYYLIAQPDQEDGKTMVLVIWRGHRIWCISDKHFSREALIQSNPATALITDGTSQLRAGNDQFEDSTKASAVLQNAEEKNTDVEILAESSANTLVTCGLAAVYLATGFAIGLYSIALISQATIIQLLTQPFIINLTVCFLVASILWLVQNL